MGTETQMENWNDFHAALMKKAAELKPDSATIKDMHEGFRFLGSFDPESLKSEGWKAHAKALKRLVAEGVNPGLKGWALHQAVNDNALGLGNPETLINLGKGMKKFKETGMIEGTEESWGKHDKAWKRVYGKMIKNATDEEINGFVTALQKYFRKEANKERFLKMIAAMREEQ